MKRREALKNLGVGVTAGLVLPAWLNSCSKDEEGPEVEYDGVVGIVGAGAAGLAVADYLISKGISVKIFEASARVGGRIESIRQSNPVFNELAADFPVELGADRIFGTDSKMGSIIKLLKVPTTKFREAPTSAEDYYIVNNEYLNRTEATALTGFTTLETLRKTGQDGYSGGGSMQDAANAAGATADLQGIVNSWLGNELGSSADRVGANAMLQALFDIQHDKTEFMLTTNPISDVITSRYDKALKRVQLNSPVKNVNYSEDNNIILTLESGATETVTKLVVTSSVTVLKDSSKISFTPSLPASKTNALSRIGMDASIRAIIEFTRNDFFQKPEGSDLNPGPMPAFIYGGVECPAYFFAGVGRSDKNLTVSLTINGQKAEELSALADDDARIAHILEEMDVVFDGKATLNIRKRSPDAGGTIISVVKDWTKEPYILGGQSYPLAGGTNDDRVELAAPIDQKIFFAGEATDVTGEFGTISGALKSAERAAEEVVTAILEENTAS